MPGTPRSIAGLVTLSAAVLLSIPMIPAAAATPGDRLPCRPRSGPHLAGRDLTRTALPADLSCADLRGAKRADLSGATMARAKTYDAQFDDAKLVGVDLTDAAAYGADMRRADLRRIKAAKARLYGATFIRTVLRQADLSGAQLYESVMTGADF